MFSRPLSNFSKDVGGCAKRKILVHLVIFLVYQRSKSWKARVLLFFRFCAGGEKVEEESKAGGAGGGFAISLSVQVEYSI